MAVPLRALTTRQWEQLATAVEAGKRIWAGALDVSRGTLPRVADVVESVWRPWHELGLPASSLGSIRVTPRRDLPATRRSPPQRCWAGSPRWPTA
ncbi:hypothetical protein AHiyo4_32770 [Arthrobacter sp. Hiyo4]|nr:hypothetical protein AHiyo4_32770 [Arthrobacter sp. Hiyo4]